MADFKDNAERARLPVPDDRALMLRCALRDNPDDTRAFFAFERRVPLLKFFNPENIQRIVNASGLTAP